MKKIISLVLSIAMVFALCAVPSSADGVIKHANFDTATLDGAAFSGDVNTSKNEGKNFNFYGWLASTEEITAIGYKLGDNATVTDASFKRSPEQGVVNAAKGLGADYSSRFDMTFPVTKGTYTLKLIAVTTSGEQVFREINCAENSYISVESASGAGIGVWISSSHTSYQGVEFNAASPFNRISIPEYWAAKSDLNIVFELFSHTGDYDTSVAGTALYRNEFTVNGDNSSGIVFELGKDYDAGAYVIRFTLGDGSGYFVLPSAPCSYSTSRIIHHGSSFHFDVNFVEDTSLDYYFAKLPGTEGYAETISGNLISKGANSNTPVNARDSAVGVRFTVPEGRKLYSITGLASPTWSNTAGDSDAKAEVYAWNTDYSSTVAGEVLATAILTDHKDNQNAVFVFDKPVPAGDILVVFTGTSTGSIGFWCGPDKENATEAYVNGETKGLYPATTAEYVIINNQTVSIGDINANGMSFDTIYANGGIVKDGGARAYLDENFPNGIIDLTKAITSLGVRGWAGFKQPIDSFGYSINGAAPVYGDFVRDAEDGVINAGGQYAKRYEITIPVDSVKGVASIVAVARLMDGTVVKMDGTDKHSHDTTLLYINELKEAASRDELKVGSTQIGSMGNNPAVSEANLTEYIGKEITMWGWYGNNINIVKFGYIIDENDAVYSDSFTVGAEPGVVNAVNNLVGLNAHASRYNILVPIEKGSHTIKAVCDIGGVDVVFWTVNYSAGEDETPVITDDEVKPTYRLNIDDATGKTSVENGGLDNPTTVNVTVDYGQKVEIIGWFVSDQGMTKLQLSIDGGDYVDATGSYRARQDVLDAFKEEKWDATLNAAPGIGLDSDWMDLTGTETLTPGTHVIALRAIGADGTEYDCGTVNVLVKGYRVSLDGATGISNQAGGGLCTPVTGDITVDAGKMIEILGWIVTDQGMTKIQVSVDDGEYVDADGSYRARRDVLDAFKAEKWNAELNTTPGFGVDDNWIDLTGTDALAAGTYTVKLRACAADGSTYEFATLNVTVNEVIEPKVSTDSETYTEGADVTVTFEGSISAKDWIAIAPAGTEYREVPAEGKVWVYTSGTQTPADAVIGDGNAVLSLAGLAAGEYTVYLFADDGYDVLATAQITVEAEVPPTTDEPAAQTGDFSFAPFAVVMVLAAAAAVIFAKRRVF